MLEPGHASRFRSPGRGPAGHFLRRAAAETARLSLARRRCRRRRSAGSVCAHVGLSLGTAIRLTYSATIVNPVGGKSFVGDDHRHALPSWSLGQDRGLLATSGGRQTMLMARRRAPISVAPSSGRWTGRKDEIGWDRTSATAPSISAGLPGVRDQLRRHAAQAGEVGLGVGGVGHPSGSRRRRARERRLASPAQMVCITIGAELSAQAPHRPPAGRGGRGPLPARPYRRRRGADHRQSSVTRWSN